MTHQLVSPDICAVANPYLTTQAKRMIPLFLLRNNRLVKGTSFDHYIDVGDPISQAKIFDAQGADEVAIVDIDATREGRLMPMGILQRMIRECKLPIAAGGGIASVEDARAYFQAGADKIILNTQAVRTPALIRELASEYGSQAVLVSLDVKQMSDGQYTVHTHSGQHAVETPLEAVVETCLQNGAGELMVTAMAKEGGLSGLDVSLYAFLRSMVSIPLIASGGAGCYDDMVTLFQASDADAVALGKMLFLRDYDMVRIKAYLKGQKVPVREA